MLPAQLAGCLMLLPVVVAIRRAAAYGDAPREVRRLHR